MSIWQKVRSVVGFLAVVGYLVYALLPVVNKDLLTAAGLATLTYCALGFLDTGWPFRRSKKEKTDEDN